MITNHENPISAMNLNSFFYVFVHFTSELHWSSHRRKREIGVRERGNENTKRKSSGKCLFIGRISNLNFCSLQIARKLTILPVRELSHLTHAHCNLT